MYFLEGLRIKFVPEVCRDIVSGLRSLGTGPHANCGSSSLGFRQMQHVGSSRLHADRNNVDLIDLINNKFALQQNMCSFDSHIGGTSWTFSTLVGTGIAACVLTRKDFFIE